MGYSCVPGVDVVCVYMNGKGEDRDEGSKIA
jgi:hypothetical protein